MKFQNLKDKGKTLKKSKGNAITFAPKQHKLTGIKYLLSQSDGGREKIETFRVTKESAKQPTTSQKFNHVHEIKLNIKILRNLHYFLTKRIEKKSRKHPKREKYKIL